MMDQMPSPTPRRRRRRRRRSPDLLVEVRLVSEPTAESPDDPGPQAAVPDELEAAFGVREDRIEQREGEVADGQAKRECREQELNTYVTRLQTEFSRRA